MSQTCVRGCAVVDSQLLIKDTKGTPKRQKPDRGFVDLRPIFDNLEQNSENAAKIESPLGAGFAA